MMKLIFINSQIVVHIHIIAPKFSQTHLSHVKIYKKSGNIDVLLQLKIHHRK